MGERCQNFGLKSVQLKKNRSGVWDLLHFHSGRLQTKVHILFFRLFWNTLNFQYGFLFHLKQSCPYPFGRKILYISSCFTKWLDDKKRWWLIFFFTRRGALPLFRVPPHCSLNVFVRMALPTINTPPLSHNSQISQKGGSQFLFIGGKKTCGHCPCIFQGGSAHLPVWAQTLLLAQW